MALALFLCITGFLYQSITFMNHVFEYPTAIDIHVRNLQTVQVPAYTFCYNNVMKRSLFCNKYPNYCVKPTEEFCSKHSSYCTNKTVMIPRSDFFNGTLPFAVEEFLSMGGSIKDFLMPGLNYGNFLKGPFMRINNDGRPISMCYSLKSVANTTNDPVENDITLHVFLDDLPLDYFHFYANFEEMFDPYDKPGVFFSIHSPYEEENPFLKGIYLKPGKSYQIYFTVSEVIMLKQPYRTNCSDYIEIWEKNNRTGPRNKKMCSEKCYEDYFMETFKCKHGSALYSAKNLCPLDFDYKNVSGYTGFKVPVDCKLNCNNDCKTITYRVSVIERDLGYRDVPGNADPNKYMFASIHPGDKQVVTLIHTPKYVNVEVFSAIGGFIGCWLGISLMDITDVFMRFIMIGRYASKRDKNSDSKEDIAIMLDQRVGNRNSKLQDTREDHRTNDKNKDID